MAQTSNASAVQAMGTAMIGMLVNSVSNTSALSSVEQASVLGSIASALASQSAEARRTLSQSIAEVVKNTLKSSTFDASNLALAADAQWTVKPQATPLSPSLRRYRMISHNRLVNRNALPSATSSSQLCGSPVVPCRALRCLTPPPVHPLFFQRPSRSLESPTTWCMVLLQPCSPPIPTEEARRPLAAS
ncbi:Hypothetical protein, putative [Bodo saltans]|uniref:Uncharacterized protein n=1 Tax=Bodo saltans TaxID=75058 RepID=A0A0S4JEC6_BODSA|nr:Hypothetical protein, putative [Bodo saltans]|eukprot:CUG89730.1 Hypothetical protein, putative [Bodo saltans]